MAFKTMEKKKIVNIIFDIITALIVIIVIAIGVSAIVNSNVGYNEFFGIAGVSVQSDSMKGDKSDSFKKGDLIYMKLLKSDEAKADIKENDIITFWGEVEGKRALITHRVVNIASNENSTVITTHGDANPEGAYEFVQISQVVGKFNGSKLAGMGNVVDFFNSKTGFMIFVVVPSLLLVLYAGIKVYKAFKDVHKESIETAVEGMKAELSAEEKEKLRQELLEELKKESDIDSKIKSD